MGLHANVKGISTITLILLIVISAVIGGIISYAFTIAYYAKIPEETALTITGVYINPKNVREFNITVLNPSYSPKNANITRIAISLKNGTQLYDVVETKPSINNGLEVRVGEALNITCQKIRKDNNDISFGEFVSTFPGKTILVHVFAEGSPAANMETRLPRVKLEITADFKPNVSFKKFNVTLTNSPESEVNLTIVDVQIPIAFEEVKPDFRLHPVDVPINESVRFEFNGSWHGFTAAYLSIFTQQGYEFHKMFEMKTVHVRIQAVTFNENQTDRFNVAVYNFAESANPVNIKNIECTLENGSKLIFDCGLAEISPNTTKVFTFGWDWRSYREKSLRVVAYFAQDFATLEYQTRTPPSVILKFLNVENAFNLKDKEHFNITILNHASSLETVNITKIVVNRAEQELPIADGLISPGLNKTFTCNFTWATFLKDYGRSLNLTVYAVSNQTLEEYTFNLSFTLPVAELNITAINHVELSGTGYLNLTVKNLGYSVWNLTLSKVVITIQGLPEPLEYTFPREQVIIKVGAEAILLCPLDWQKYVGKSVAITIITEELTKVSMLYTFS